MMKMSEEKLLNIQDLLEDIKMLLLLTNQDKVEEVKKKLLTSNSIEETVYKLCNGDNTSLDIAKTIKKDNGYTLAVLNNLRKKGLIKTVKQNGNKVYEQRF